MDSCAVTIAIYLLLPVGGVRRGRRSPGGRSGMRILDMSSACRNPRGCFSAPDNVALPLRRIGAPGRIAKRRAAELLEAFGLAGRLDVSPKTLSGGREAAREPGP